jgi:hypothetical protein
MNGIMAQQGSNLAEGIMHFATDKPRNGKKQKSQQRRSERKHYKPKADLE